MKLTLRKAYKASCEIRDKLVKIGTIMNTQTSFNVQDTEVTLADGIAKHLKRIEDAQSKLFHGLQTAQVLRNLIAAANNRPLSYADGRSINDLIAEQTMIKEMLKALPEGSVTELDDRVLHQSVTRQRNLLADQTYGRSTSQNVTISGVFPAYIEKLDGFRLKLRSDLDNIVGKLAYANINETVEIADKDLEVLKAYQIPL